MIRKAIIVVLTLGTVLTGMLWISSHICWEDEIYDVGSWTCRVNCNECSCWSPFDRGPDLNFKCSAGIGSVYTTEKVAAYTSEEHRESRLGFGLEWGYRAYVYHDDEYLEATNWTTVVLPMWLMFTLFAAYPTFAFVRGPVRRWRRRRRGRCTKCGYDLTGNESGVCPECGKPVRLAATVPSGNE